MGGIRQSRTSPRAMEITAGGDQQAELTGQDRQAANLLGRLMAVDHLNGMAPA